MKTIGINIIIILLHLPFLAISQEDGWNLRADKDGIKVYIRDADDTSVKEFKGKMLLETEMTVLEKIMDDYSKLHEWQSNVNEVTLLKVESDTTKYLYFITGLPWPMDNRDSIFKNIKRWSKDSTNLLFKNVAVPDYLPLEKGLVRIDNASGFWNFEEIDGKIDVTYHWTGDPGGKIPSWIINLFIVDGPFKTLQNLRGLVGE